MAQIWPKWFLARPPVETIHAPGQPRPIALWRLPYPGGRPSEAKVACVLYWLPIEEAPFELRQQVGGKCVVEIAESDMHSLVKGECATWAVLLLAGSDRISHYVELPDMG